MKLPGAERAIVDMAKLRDYCLNEHHARGRHKARVFALALGITTTEADVLRRTLQNAAFEGEAVATDGGVIWSWIPFATPVIPAKAGIQSVDGAIPMDCGVDSRFRGNDCSREHPCLASNTTTFPPNAMTTDRDTC